MPRASQVVHFWDKSPHLGPLTSTKPWFSCRNITLGTHGSLWADICVPKPLRNHHYWALLRAPNHGFPVGIVHLAHMAPYGPTFVCQNSLGTATIGPFLRARNHCFPAGILHLAHMAPYGPTFVCQISLGKSTSGALLRAPNRCFPVGVLHLAHMAPYGPTFVCQIS